MLTTAGSTRSAIAVKGLSRVDGSVETDRSLASTTGERWNSPASMKPTTMPRSKSPPATISTLAARIVSRDSIRLLRVGGFWPRLDGYQDYLLLLANRSSLLGHGRGRRGAKSCERRFLLTDASVHLGDSSQDPDRLWVARKLRRPSPSPVLECPLAQIGQGAGAGASERDQIDSQNALLEGTLGASAGALREPPHVLPHSFPKILRRHHNPPWDYRFLAGKRGPAGGACQAGTTLQRTARFHRGAAPSYTDAPCPSTVAPTFSRMPIWAKAPPNPTALGSAICSPFSIEWARSARPSS